MLHTLGNIFTLRGNEEQMYSNLYCPEGPQHGYQPLQSSLRSEIEDFASEKISFKKERFHFQGK